MDEITMNEQDMRVMLEEERIELMEDQSEFLDSIGEHDETNYDPYAGCDVFERTGEEMDGEDF